MIAAGLLRWAHPAIGVAGIFFQPTAGAADPYIIDGAVSDLTGAFTRVQLRPFVQKGSPAPFQMIRVGGVPPVIGLPDASLPAVDGGIPLAR